jgi:hypothetical protein
LSERAAAGSLTASALFLRCECKEHFTGLDDSDSIACVHIAEHAELEQSTQAFHYVLSSNVLKRSASIALVVGCILSIANQYDIILREPMSTRLALKIVMNFCVPFIVASVSAVLNRR